MTIADIKPKMIRKGVCFYSGIKEYAVYLCKENILYGTGDYEDLSGIAEDRVKECYTIYFSDLLNGNKINASAGQYESLEKAIEAAESSEGFYNWEEL